MVAAGWLSPPTMQRLTLVNVLCHTARTRPSGTRSSWERPATGGHPARHAHLSRADADRRTVLRLGAGGNARDHPDHHLGHPLLRLHRLHAGPGGRSRLDARATVRRLLDCDAALRPLRGAGRPLARRPWTEADD